MNKKDIINLIDKEIEDIKEHSKDLSHYARTKHRHTRLVLMKLREKITGFENKLYYAYDPTIKKRVAFVKKGGYLISLVTGHKLKEARHETNK